PRLAVPCCLLPYTTLFRSRLGLPGREEEIGWFCTLLENMGRLHIPVLSYSFMAVFDWMRTATDEASRGGALVTSYDHDIMEHALDRKSTRLNYSHGRISYA